VPASATEQYLLQAKAVTKRYGDADVLTAVDFAIEPGEKVCILGPSGSGKTTLLRCLNLLVQPTSGELRFKGQLIWSSPSVGKVDMNLRSYRSRVAMVFQQFELFPHLSASDNVALGPRHSLHVDTATAKRRAVELLGRVGLEQFANARPRTLSGGQQQRVAIARALAMNPDVILFDEPTSALDWEMVGEVLEIMASLAADGMTMVIVTHELDFARQCADRVIVMERGEIIEQGPTSQMFEAPRLQRTREILGLARSEARYKRFNFPNGPA
jgi:ABC-type polar amino acid transport system ATPase subunit